MARADNEPDNRGHSSPKMRVQIIVNGDVLYDSGFRIEAPDVIETRQNKTERDPYTGQLYILESDLVIKVEDR